MTINLPPCRTCKFWWPDPWGDSKQVGMCCRYPPYKTNAWPKVTEGSGCGEHQEREFSQEDQQ